MSDNPITREEFTKFTDKMHEMTTEIAVRLSTISQQVLDLDGRIPDLTHKNELQNGEMSDLQQRLSSMEGGMRAIKWSIGIGFTAVALTIAAARYWAAIT